MADLDRLPDGVSIDTSKKVIQCTRSALEKLGDWCSKTAQVVGLTLIVTAGADTALAQGANTKTGAKVEVTLVPLGSTPIPPLSAKDLGALSVESVNVLPSTSASAAVDKKDGGQLASNGQELRVLAQLPAEELGKLPPNIQVELETWMDQQEKKINAKLSTSLQEGSQNQATISTSLQEGSQNQATISAQFEKCTEQQVQLEKSLSEEGKLALKGDIVSIKNNPGSPEYQELILKGVTEEQIKSGKADSMITALYTYNNQAKFLEKGWVVKGKEADFQQTVDNFSDILGKDRRNLGDIPKFVESKFISGERKEMVLQGVDKLVSSGKYNLSQTTYNAESGYITFHTEKKGESTRIDTSRNPPKIEYIKNGISIGKDVEQAEISPEQKEREKGIQTEKKNFSEQKSSLYTSLLKGHQELFDPSDDGKKFVERYQKFSFSDALDPQKRVEMLGAIDAEKSRIQGLPEKMDNEALDGRQKGAKESIEKSLERIKETINTTAKNIDSLPKVPKSNEDTFESIANYNLNFLSKIGYDGIGQDNMERIIRTLNSSQNPSRSSVGEIDLNQKLDTPKTQSLTLAIANLVRNGRTSTGQPPEEQKKTEESQKSYDNVDKSDPYIAARQTQSLGFRESLRSVARNMSQEGGSLKTDSAIKKVLFGIDTLPKENSADNAFGEKPILA